MFSSVLTNLGRNILIYGWSIGDEDEHLLRQLGQNDLNYVAVSLMLEERTQAQVAEKMATATRKIQEVSGPEVTVEFFDASSANCWVNE